MSDDEIWAVLLRFHREVFLPDFDRILSERISGDLDSLRILMLDGFARLHDRLDGMIRPS